MIAAAQVSPVVPAADQSSSILRLGGVGLMVMLLTIAIPFAFERYGDNAFIALAIAAALLTAVATKLAERSFANQTLWLILTVGVLLRAYVLLFDPFLSSDIFRYVWDGRVQAAGINPYRYVPADQTLAFLRDMRIFPHINRVDTAVTIYPPVAQYFFLVVTRLGESVTVMRLALLGCEAVAVLLILMLLRRMNRPATRVVAYVWHPLPLWEIASSGHVDALMVALMLLGLFLALTGRVLGGAAILSLAVLAKPFAAPAFAGIWRPWDVKMPLVVIVTIACCYLPYISVGWGVLGFLTQGYLTEEGISAGYDLWPLALWRLIAGKHGGDVAAYGAIGTVALVLFGLWISLRPARPIAARLADINTLLLVALLFVSPNYPWYFLVVTPFVALCRSLPAWVVSIGALMLSEQLDWDFYIPRMVSKSVLFGGLLVAWLVVDLRTRWEQKAKLEACP